MAWFPDPEALSPERQRLRPAPAWLRGAAGAGVWLLRAVDRAVANAAGWAWGMMLLGFAGFGLWQWLAADFATGVLVGAVYGPVTGFILMLATIPLLWVLLAIGNAVCWLCRGVARLGRWELTEKMWWSVSN